MVTKPMLIIALLFYSLLGYSQKQITGFVKDAVSGELLIGAAVYADDSKTGTITNANGYFSFSCNSDSLYVSYVGYQKQHIRCITDSILQIYLEPGQTIDEVNVYAQGIQKFNKLSLSVNELKAIPALGATPDVLKTLQLLPGIQSQAEGTSHINVRGGNPGENLYLIDDVPLLYVNHLGGFMSVFNPDMINKMDVYKGAFPAKYGGKLSSILAINQREGNISNWNGSVGVGITDASFSIEGPLFDKKGSLIVTARKTLIDYPMMLISMLADQDFIVNYGFHDVNAKLSYRPNSNNSFHINLYQGDDYLRYKSDFKSRRSELAKIKNRWGNWMLSGRWSRVVSPRLFVNNILSTTNYRLKVLQYYSNESQVISTEYERLYLSRVNNSSLSSDWQYKVTPYYNIEFGGSISSFNHIPNRIEASDIEAPEFEKIRSFENVIYVNKQYNLLNLFDFEIGFRLTNYMSNGFSKTALEPRLNVNLDLPSFQTVNFSYQTVNQYSHLLLTSGAVMNNEIWVPADENLNPSESIQYSLGWKGSIKKQAYNIELSIYHKELNNLATYKEGYSNLLGDGGWRNKIESGGTGQSQGVELLVQKNKGKWTGFLAYTYSKTTRQFEKINKGNPYLFDFDRPHSGSVNINRKLTDRCTASITWVYQTGLPYTPVLGRQYAFGLFTDHGSRDDLYEEVLIYGERNSARMPDYHRLDVGLSWNTVTKKGRKAEWNLSVYNAYNRHNPTAYYYSEADVIVNSNNGIEKYQAFNKYKVSFFPIIPSISYKLYFEERIASNKDFDRKPLESIKALFYKN